jgi:hypothetical protein
MTARAPHSAGVPAARDGSTDYNRRVHPQPYRANALVVPVPRKPWPQSVVTLVAWAMFILFFLVLWFVVNDWLCR